MKILINYADRGYKEAQKRNSASGWQFGFDKVIEYNVSSIDDEFKLKNWNILSQPRGAGYWLWKPYIILKTMKESQPNDIIFYSDSGSHFMESVRPLFDICEKENIVIFGLPHVNRTWIKMDAFYYMNLINTDAPNAGQVVGGHNLWKNIPVVRQIAEEWLHYSQDARIITDAPNTCGLKNFPDFQDHRHDQAILSLIAYKHKIKLHKDPSQYGSTREFTVNPQFPNDTYAQIINLTRFGG